MCILSVQGWGASLTPVRCLRGRNGGPSAMTEAQMHLSVSRCHRSCFSNGVRVCPVGVQRAGPVSPGRGQCTPDLSSLSGVMAGSELGAGPPVLGQ